MLVGPRHRRLQQVCFGPVRHRPLLPREAQHLGRGIEITQPCGNRGGFFHNQSQTGTTDI